VSYILDALKKAERQRELAKVPRLATVQQPVEVAPRRLWPWIAGAVVVANIGILTWLLTPSRDTPMPAPGEPVRPASPAGATSAPIAASSEPAPKSAPDTGASSAATARSTPDAAGSSPAASGPPPAVATVAPETRPASPPQPAAVSPPPAAPSRPAAPARSPEAPAPAKGRTASVAPSTAAPKRAEAPAPAAGRPALATKSNALDKLAPPVAAAPADPAAPKLSAAEIAGKIRIQFLVYSDVPSERLVFLNNQKYVEGQSIDDKLTVERIMPDGVVIRNQGERVVLRADGAPR